MNSDIVSKEAFVISLPFFFRYLTVWFVSVPENRSLITSVCGRVCETRFLYILIETPFTHGILITKLKITVQKSEKKSIWDKSLIGRSPCEIAFVILQAWIRAVVS